MQAVNLSRAISSSQAGIHPRLRSVLDRHKTAEWKNPLHPPSCRAFERLAGLLSSNHAPLVLDSGCGNGQSTRALARAYPHSLVLGVDKSAARLSRLGARRFPYREGNAVWLRAELSSFWRLLLQAGWPVQSHYLLYPNPWPKPGQLQRRWHAHPVFADMLRLAERLEMRCNWAVYADEFAFSVNYLTGASVRPVPLEPAEALSPFERKYRDSGHSLYSLVFSPSRGVK